MIDAQNTKQKEVIVNVVILHIVYDLYFESDDVPSDDVNRWKNGDDFSTQWTGLNLNLLVDIYHVHKGLLFGQFQFQDYTMKQFMANAQSADETVFKDAICSPNISKNKKAFSLSFHPSYVINDDIFEVMACHYAVSSLVNRLDLKAFKGDQLRIRSIVAPAAVTSIYDSTVEHRSTIDNVADYITSISSSNTHICRGIKCDIADISTMTQILSKMLELITPTVSNGDMVIAFDRQNGLKRVSIFECNDVSELKGFYKNYFLGFDLKVTQNSGNANGPNGNRLVRCWMRFGENQRMRFYPEFSTWIVPRLFARNEGITASKFVDKLYSAEYKWGWRVSLDDPVFNRYYQMITKYEHVSVNYNRDEMSASTKFSDSGIRDHLEQRVRRPVVVGLVGFFGDHAFDSDAILEDVIGAKSHGELTEFGHSKPSNIAGFMSQWNPLHFRAIKHRLFRYQDMECCSKNEMPIEQCPFIDDVVADLKMLQEHDFNVDVTNYLQYELESVTSARDHIILVHRLLSAGNEEDQKRIRRHIQSHVQCTEQGSTCKVVKAQKERIDKKEEMKRNAEEPDQVTGECEALCDTLYDLHCRVFHADVELPRPTTCNNRFELTIPDSDSKTESKEESKTEENAPSDPAAINFGLSVLRWLQFGDSALFDSLREELIKNPDSTISPKIYDNLRRECAAKIKDTVFTLKEMLSLKAYSDTTAFQAALGRAHWDTGNMSDEKKLSFYHWAMTLYKVHLYHATPISPKNESSTKPRALYTGMSQILTLSHELGAYFGPLSTTTSFSVATRFSKGNGQIFTYQPSYINPLRFCMGIDMQIISCFPDEYEVMLYHQFLPIQGTKTFGDDTDKLVNHLLHSLKSRAAPIVRKEAFYKKLGIKWTSSWVPLILSHRLLYDVTACEPLTVYDRLGKELKVPYFELVPMLRDAMFLDQDWNLKLKKTSKISPKLLSHFIFKATYEDGTEGNVRKYAPMNVDEFDIKCVPKTLTTGHVIGLKVFIEPKNHTYLPMIMYNVAMNDDDLEREDSLIFGEMMHVIQYESERGIFPNLIIKSSSDITISTTGGISAEIYDSEQSLDSQRRMERAVITLSSNGIFTNNGALRCRASGDVKRKAVAGCIIAQSFTNNGTIGCEPNTGSLYISCREYLNTGIMYPVPDIVMRGDEKRMRTSGIWSESEERIPLSVSDYRGCYDSDSDYHPKNLLVDDASSFYCSDDSSGRKAVGDWIIFRINSSTVFKPSSIQIRNHRFGTGIKSLSLWLHTINGEWRKICKNIEEIHTDNKKPQRFSLSLLLTDKELLSEGTDLLMLEFLGNYGWDYNQFYAFNLYGYPLME